MGRIGVQARRHVGMLARRRMLGGCARVVVLSCCRVGALARGGVGACWGSHARRRAGALAWGGVGACWGLRARCRVAVLSCCRPDASAWGGCRMLVVLGALLQWCVAGALFCMVHGRIGAGLQGNGGERGGRRLMYHVSYGMQGQK